MVPPYRRLVVESLTLPKSAARRILGAPLSSGQALSVGVVAIISSTLAVVFLQLLWPMPGNPLADALLAAPLLAVALQVSVFLVTTALVARVGRAFGGEGDYRGAINLVAWLQVMLTLAQFAQLALLLILPVFAALLNLATVFWYFWALASVTAALHGFGNVLKVLGMIFITMIAVLFLTAILMTMLGVPVPEIQ
ncbi:YIP1 family protein [Oceanibium sediminis]|uniref:YIP1 family protein n=1 Tax=Oceanibium sediminis TaxID=2026339 RepID=UPI000DD43A4A|nr:YIP1 family protein [Oceanibium sediminis]